MIQSESHLEALKLITQLAQHSDQTNNQLNQVLLENVRGLLGLPVSKTQDSTYNEHGMQPSKWASGGSITAATDHGAIDETVKKLFKELQQ